VALELRFLLTRLRGHAERLLLHHFLHQFLVFGEFVFHEVTASLQLEVLIFQLVNRQFVLNIVFVELFFILVNNSGFKSAPVFQVKSRRILICEILFCSKENLIPPGSRDRPFPSEQERRAVNPLLVKVLGLQNISLRIILVVVSVWLRILRLDVPLVIIELDLLVFLSFSRLRSDSILVSALELEILLILQRKKRLT